MLYKNQTVGELEVFQQSSVNNLNDKDSNPSELHAPNAPPKEGNADQTKLEELFQKLQIDDMTHLSSDEISQVKQLISKYRNIFHDDETGLPAANVPEHDIILDTDKIIRTPYRQIPLAMKPKAKELIQDLINKDIIEPSTSPYHSPSFIIRRGSKFRLVTDYRNINRHVIRGFQPLPSIESLTSLWAGCRYWSVLDLQSAYFQVKLSEKSKRISATSIPGVAFFQYKRIPLGISSAVGYFHGILENALLDLNNCVNYLDDLASGAEMKSNIKAIFKRLQEIGLRLRADKTK